MISSESLTEEFHRALDTMKLSGIDGNGKTRHFIPRNTLENYLDPGRVQSLLQSYRLPTSMAGEIRNKYLRTFAALLFLNRPLYITEFLRRAINDDNLPISEHWPYSSDEGESFRLAIRDMYENQWAFCPIEFGPKIMHKKNIEKSQILPILESKELTTGGFTRCWKVRIHSWFGTSPRENPQQTVFAVKEFTRANERDFDAEVEALAALSHRPSPHIVQYLGSYVHGNKLNLILEYADHGSLNEYLQSSKPPCSAMNLQAFWNSAMGLLRGLNFLHHASLFDVETGSMVGVHNDIKPENILVFGNNKQELYDLTFKIGGIRMSSRRTPKGNHPSLCGTEAYRPPEYDPGTHDRGKQRLYDIWSLGCILLEMVVWAMLGSDGLKRFWGARANELSPQEDGEPSFHNGTAPLNEVLLMYEHIRSLLAPHDIWTRIVLDLVENHMLVRSKSGRLFAGDIHRMWIDRSQKAFDSTADIDSIEMLPLKTISRASTTFDGREIHTTKNSVLNASVDGLHSTIPSNLVGRAHHCITCNSRTMGSFRTEHLERHRDKKWHRFRNGADIHSGIDFPSHQIPREVESLEHT